MLGQKDILMECALYIRSHAKEPLSVQGLDVYKRQDLNYYDFTLNEENITIFIE